MNSEQLAARPGVIGAYTASASALLAVLTAMAAQTEGLAGQVGQGFGQHPDAEIYRSQPGLGVILSARVLAEFGDDPGRYGDAKARKNYSGMSRITKASGTKRVVLARFARNRRLGDALFLQAFAALNNSPRSARSMTGNAPAEPPTTKPSEPSRTGSSASSTAACGIKPSTTSISPGTQRTRQTQPCSLTACDHGMSSQLSFAMPSYSTERLWMAVVESSNQLLTGHRVASKVAGRRAFKCFLTRKFATFLDVKSWVESRP